MAGATISNTIAPPVPLAVAGEVLLLVGAAPLRMELSEGLPEVEEPLFVEVVLPGPTKKKVAPRRVRFPAPLTNLVKLKSLRF